MTKQDLKTGMLVQCVNGNVYLLINDVFIRGEGQIFLTSYSHTLECYGAENFDIIKVSEILKRGTLRPENWTRKTIDNYLLWSRDSGFVGVKTVEKPLRKEEFDIETSTWTETK